MSKQSLLLVDGDPRSLRVLEVSLRKAGFTVSTAESARAAQEKIVVATPDLIISEIKLDDGDGFDLCRRVRATPEWQDIPFMFLTGEVGIENKIRGLELGVDEYLTKPIYIKEIVTRIHMLLQKRQRARIEERKDQRTRFVGRIADMPVVDVIQTIEVSRKSGVIHFVGERNRQAAIYFRDGKVIDAEAGALQAEDAVYRLLTWNEGDFEVVFRTVRRRDVIQIGSQALLMEGMRRLDEWTRLLEQMPPLGAHVDVNLGKLAAKLGEVPDEANRLLRLIDGKRSLMDVIDACDLGDLEALQALSQLRVQGLLQEVEPEAAVEAELPKLSLDEVVASARNEESGPLEMPEVVASSQGTSGVAPGMLPSSDILAPHGFRPSGLRLVDEAVAAAQAIDPDIASWPTGDLVARTITGRARTHSSISSIERSLVERSPATPDPPSLPRARTSPIYEVSAPSRARTEPGIGTAAPLPYVGPSGGGVAPREAAQMAAVQPEAAGEAPRRSRSITAQTARTRTPPYGARISGAIAAVDEASFNDLDAELEGALDENALLMPSSSAGGSGEIVATKRASSRELPVIVGSFVAAPSTASGEALPASGAAAGRRPHEEESSGPITSRSKTPGGPYLEAVPGSGARRPSTPAVSVAAAAGAPSNGGARKVPTPTDSSPALAQPADSSDERYLQAAARTRASSQRPISAVTELPRSAAPTDSGPVPGKLITDSTPIVVRKDTGTHRVRTVTGSLLPESGGAAISEARKTATPSRSMPAVQAEAAKPEARQGRAKTSEIEVEAGWDDDAQATEPARSDARAAAGAARPDETKAAATSGPRTGQQAAARAEGGGAGLRGSSTAEGPRTGQQAAARAEGGGAGLRGSSTAEGPRTGQQVAARAEGGGAGLRGSSTAEGPRTGQQAAEGRSSSGDAKGAAGGAASSSRRTGPIATLEPASGDEGARAASAGPGSQPDAAPTGRPSSNSEGTKVPTPSRTGTRPSLPPGSGTSVAIARKRRPSPAPNNRVGLQPAGLDPAAAPAALARITTEQRAVKPLDVVETVGARREQSEDERNEAVMQRRETRRMITSLGAATAEVSGEVEAPFEEPAQPAAPQRQMVTILPRRITREMPVVEAAVEISEELAPVAPARPTPAASPVATGGANKRVTRELRIEPDMELAPVRKSNPSHAAVSPPAGATPAAAEPAGVEGAAGGPSAAADPGGRRVTRELPAAHDEGEPTPANARATRPLLTRRRVTEPGAPLSEQEANVSSGRRTTREMPAESMLESAASASAASRRTGSEPPPTTGRAAMVTSEMSATAASKDADLALDEARPSTRPGSESEDADAGELIVSEQEVGAAKISDAAIPVGEAAAAKGGETSAKGSEGASKASEGAAKASEGAAKASEGAAKASEGVAKARDAASKEREEPSTGKAAAVAVSPRWSGTSAEKPLVRRLTAIAFGVAGLLVIILVAVWLRGKPTKPQATLPDAILKKGAAPDARLPDAARAPDAAAAPANGVGTTGTPVNGGTPTETPVTNGGTPTETPVTNGGTPTETPTETPVNGGTPTETPVNGGTPTETPVKGGTPTETPTETPAEKPVTNGGTPAPVQGAGADEAKPDPAKEAKALLAKAKKALAEGSAEGALLHIDESLALKKSARAHLMRSAALQAMGRTEDALAAVDRALAMADGLAEGWLTRGKVLDQLGRTGEARAAFARFLELQPTGAASDEIRKKLGQ